MLLNRIPIKQTYSWTNSPTEIVAQMSTTPLFLWPSGGVSPRSPFHRLHARASPGGAAPGLPQPLWATQEGLDPAPAPGSHSPPTGSICSGQPMNRDFHELLQGSRWDYPCE